MSAPFLARTERILRRFLEAAVVAGLTAMAVICFVEVVLRYRFAESFGWYDEFTGYLLVWLTFLGAVLAQLDNRHIGVGNLFRRLSPKGCLYRDLILTVLMVAIHVLLLVKGWQLAARLSSEQAITLPVPMGFVYAVIPLSAAFMLLVLTIQAARLVRGIGNLKG
jgi:TRAP-type C4-dicarboxylate transport system permease small subunit